ncbi:MAG: hypothetical protein KY469_03260 [Actinobacteria bacterium]|nr:hypothetical protein [Actinomycetota bacterium]
MTVPDTPRGAGALPRAVAGLLVATFVGAIVVEVVVGPRLPQDVEASAVEDLGLAIAFGAFVFTGALLVVRRPRNRLSWMIAAVGILPSVFVPLDTYGAWVQVTGRDVDPLVVFGFWGQSWYWYLLLSLLLVFVPLYLPDGRLPSPRWRPWVAVPIVSTAAMVLAGMTSPTIAANVLDGPVLDNPIGIPGMGRVEEDLGWLFFGIIFDAHVEWGSLATTMGIATAGNLVGGLGLVTLSHIAQAKGAREGGS